MDRKFTAQDFAQNPGKYRLFKTAQVAANIVTHNGEHDMSEGQHVGIEYAGTVRNALYRREEPIYRISGTDRYLYANALKNFVL